MNKQSITFTANEQTLEKTGGIDSYASNIVSYVEATFTLGTNWTGYDVVRAVWESAYARISTVLDSNAKCIVPAEVLRHKSKVNVNLVGSIVENDVLTDRLTTYPVHALTIDEDARVDSTETQPITPSQFEQFVDIVHDDAESIQDYSYDSEAWAKGTRGGVAVPSTDPAYHNNSKYYADQGAELEQEVTDLKSEINDNTSDISALQASVTNLGTHKVAQPLDGNNQPTNGTSGQLLRTRGNGATEWTDVGLPTDEQTAQAVSDWLDAHPEATTTVEDHSLSREKLINGTLGFVMPEMFGAIGDGVTDDTQAIQDALDSGLPVVFMPKTYVVSADDDPHQHLALDITSPTTIIGNGAILKLSPNSYTRYRVLRIVLTHDVYIDGLNIIGDKADHVGSTGEQGYGFLVAGSTNVHIDNCTASYCWGDGLNVAATYAPSEAESVMNYEVYVNNFESHHNRRQGISVEGCNGFYLDNAYIHDIGGTLPQAAIDFEPSPYIDEDTQVESNYEYIDNVFISNLKCENNIGVDIIVDDYHSTKQGHYLFNNCNFPAIKISSIVNDIDYGSHVQLNNVFFEQKIGSVEVFTVIEFNVDNPNTNFFGDGLTIQLNGRAPISFDKVMKGKVHFNGLSILGDTLNYQLFAIAVYTAEAVKNVVADGVYAPNGLKYASINNENLAQSGATVRLAKDMIESSKQGWFYIDNIANVYYFGPEKTANSYIQMFHMYDGYEITVINQSSYDVQLQKENSVRPNIYFDSLSTSKTITVGSGSSVTVKYSAELGAWVMQRYIGTVTAS